MGDLIYPNQGFVCAVAWCSLIKQASHKFRAVLNSLQPSTTDSLESNFAKIPTVDFRLATI